MFINCGTWIWLMQLPPADAGNDDWAKFLQLCRRNPGLDPSKGESVPLLSRFTGCLIEQREGGAQVALMEYQAGIGLRSLDEQHLKARAAS